MQICWNKLIVKYLDNLKMKMDMPTVEQEANRHKLIFMNSKSFKVYVTSRRQKIWMQKQPFESLKKTFVASKKL